MPNGEPLSISEKRWIFAIRNRMVLIPTNFPSKKNNEDQNCKKCGEPENMKHIFECSMSKENKNLKYEMIFGENRKQMKKFQYSSKQIMKTEKT